MCCVVELLFYVIVLVDADCVVGLVADFAVEPANCFVVACVGVGEWL